MLLWSKELGKKSAWISLSCLKHCNEAEQVDILQKQKYHSAENTYKLFAGTSAVRNSKRKWLYSISGLCCYDHF